MGAVVGTLKTLDVAIENEDVDGVAVPETPIGAAVVGDPVDATGVTELRDVLVPTKSTHESQLEALVV